MLILTLSRQSDDCSLIRMIKAGSKSYLLRNIQSDKLKYALDNLISKGFYYPDQAAGKVFMNMAHDTPHSAAVAAFTEKEKIFCSIAAPK